MGPDDVLNQPGAWQAYDRWLDDHRVEFLPEPAGIELPFRALCQLQRPAPKAWSDAYLAAFALVSGLVLVTFDQTLGHKAGRAVCLG